MTPQNQHTPPRKKPEVSGLVLPENPFAAEREKTWASPWMSTPPGVENPKPTVVPMHNAPPIIEPVMATMPTTTEQLPPAQTAPAAADTATPWTDVAPTGQSAVTQQAPPQMYAHANTAAQPQASAVAHAPALQTAQPQTAPQQLQHAQPHAAVQGLIFPDEMQHVADELGGVFSMNPMLSQAMTSPDRWTRAAGMHPHGALHPTGNMQTGAYAWLMIGLVSLAMAAGLMQLPLALSETVMNVAVPVFASFGILGLLVFVTSLMSLRKQ